MLVKEESDPVRSKGSTSIEAKYCFFNFLLGKRGCGISFLAEEIVSSAEKNSLLRSIFFSLVKNDFIKITSYFKDVNGLSERTT